MMKEIILLIFLAPSIEIIVSGISPLVSRISLRSYVNFHMSISPISVLLISLESDYLIVKLSSSTAIVLNFFLLDFHFLFLYFPVSVSPPKLFQFILEIDLDAVSL